jgi:hypothetical protein
MASVPSGLAKVADAGEPADAGLAVTGATTSSLAPLASAWTASGIDVSVPGPSSSRSSETFETLTVPSAGGRSTTPTMPTTPESAGGGGRTSKRVSTLTPGTTSGGMAAPYSRTHVVEVAISSRLGRERSRRLPWTQRESLGFGRSACRSNDPQVQPTAAEAPLVAERRS